MNRRRIATLFAAVFAMILVAGSLGACNAQEAADTVFKAATDGITWQWTASTTKSPASQAVVPDPENYTISFKADGTYSGKADCNQINGQWKVDANGVTIEPGASTMAACGDGSQDALFVAGLTGAKSASFSNDQMTLTNAAGDTFTFKKA